MWFRTGNQVPVDGHEPLALDELAGVDAPSDALFKLVRGLEDESVARELLRLAGVLERQGLLHNRPMDPTALSEAMRDEAYPVGSGIAVFLVSPSAASDPQDAL